MKGRFHLGAFRRRRELVQTVRRAASQLDIRPDLFEASIGRALALVQEALQLEALHLVRFDPEALAIVATYGRNGQERDPVPFCEEIISELRVKQRPLSQMVLRRYAKNPSSGKARRHKASPRAVASVIITRDQQAVMLMATRRPNLRESRADTQLLHEIGELFAQALRKHARLIEFEQLNWKSPMQQSEPSDAPAARLAHQFNNMLAAMMGYAEMAITLLDPQSTAYSYVENIIEGGLRAQEVIDENHPSGRAARELARFDLVDAIVEILPVLYLSVTQGVRLEVELPEPPLIMAGCPTELHNVLVRLCQNAGEALRGDGEVTLAIEVIAVPALRRLSHGRLPPGKHIRIAISDRRIGNSAEHFSTILEPARAGGRGDAGLSAVSRAVQSMRGSLDVREGRGVGTRFELFFPCLDEARSGAAPAYAAASTSGLQAVAELVGATDFVEGAS